MPGWDDADPVLHAAFDELKAALGDQVFEVDLPPPFAEAVRQREIVNYAEMAKCLHRHWSRAADLLGAETRAAIEEGNAIPARDYLAALDWRGILCAGLDEVFSRCDAILCPAATGPAPRGLGSTGSSIFNGLWTFTGTPAVTLPLLADEADMPMGVQIVGSRGNDARLLRTARWLEAWAASDADGDPA